MYSKQEIEQAKETMRHWVEYEKNNKDKINKADELINIQEILLQYIADLEKEKEETYWNGWAHRQAQDGEICKMCKYRKQHIEQRNKKGEEK